MPLHDNDLVHDPLRASSPTLVRSVEKHLSSASLPFVCDQEGRVNLASFIDDKFTEQQPLSTVFMSAHDRVKELTRAMATDILAVVETRWSCQFACWCLGNVAVSQYHFAEEHGVRALGPVVSVV